MAKELEKRNFAVRANSKIRVHVSACFMAAELQKQISWSNTNVAAYHYRTATGQEVDVVLEDGRGQLVAVEIKSTASAGKKDFQGIERFAQSIGDRFLKGVALYAGDNVVPFGERLHALPISSIWQ